MRIVVGLIVLLGLSVGLSAQDAPDLSTQLNTALKASADKDAVIAKLQTQVKQAQAPKLTFDEQVAQTRKTIALQMHSAFAVACKAEGHRFRLTVKAGQFEPACETK